MSLQQSSSQNIPALTGIRALAALLVLSLHVHQNVPANIAAYLPFINRGYLGVDFFFILSGFIIAHVYIASFVRLSGEALRIFLWHRFIRLYPVHVAVLLLMIAMVMFSHATGRAIRAENFNVADLIWQFTLMHAWGFGNDASWNLPSWSISAEWFAYLLFPIIALVLNRIGNARAGYLLSVAAFLVMTALFKLSGADIDSWNGPPALLRVAGEFICGAALCRAMFLEASSGQRRWSGDAVGVVAFIAFLAAASISLSDYILVALLALTVMGVAAADGFLKRFLARGSMVWLGEISYSVYMVHFPVLILLRRVYEGLGYASWPPLLQTTAYFATFAVIIVSAVPLYYFVERPTRMRLRDRLGVLTFRPADKSVARTA